MRKNLFVLADASTEIGSGHILRCLTLSQELKNKFSKIIFLTSNSSKPILENIKPISIEIMHISSLKNLKSFPAYCYSMKNYFLHNAHPKRYQLQRKSLGLFQIELEGSDYELCI